MSRAQIEADTPSHGLFSPEGVQLDLAVAGPALRILAYGMDVIVIAVLLVLTFVILSASLPIGSALHKWIGPLFHRALNGARHPNVNGRLPPAFAVIFAVLLLVQFAVESGYFVFWEILTGGRSPGKALVGLRVVQRNGLPIELGSSMVRNVFRIVDLLPTSYMVGLISMLVSPSGERLGDHAAGTIVIRLDRPQAALEIQIPPAPHSLSLTREQIKRIGPREMRLIRGTLRRASTIPDDRSHQLMVEVCETLRARLEMVEPPSSDPREFLTDLLALMERYSRE
jgi:uncharacterized RDD family membrane protein YckC